MPVLSITRVSTTGAGGQIAILPVGPLAVSPDGTRILFASGDAALVAGDTNGRQDLYIKDLGTGAVTRVSTDGGGGELTGGDATGGYFVDDNSIVFTSAATNLDGNGVEDVFLKNLNTGAVTPVSVDAGNTSGDARSVFGATAHPVAGAWVTFESDATNLVPGDTNGVQDVFAKNTVTGVIVRVSTADGTGAEATGSSVDGSLSSDGARVVFTSSDAALVLADGNGAQDIFIRTLASNAVVRISTSAAGVEGNNASYAPLFSPDGTKVAFVSAATNLVAGDTNGAADIFVKTLASGAIERISVGAGGVQGGAGLDSGNFRWSPDGARIVFTSRAGLVAADTNGFQDVYVKTLATGSIELVSLRPDGTLGDQDSDWGTFGPDGATVYFESQATNLVAGDSNGQPDLFAVTVNFPAPPVVGGGGATEPTPPPAPPPSKAPTINANFSHLTRYLTYGSNPPLPATVTTPEGKVLPNPFLAQQADIKTMIGKVDAGSMTLKAALDTIVDMADASTSVATLNYQFFTGRIPTRAGLDYLVSSPENPNDLNDGYYAGMALENRYINFAVNLGKAGEGRAAFTANYGSLSLTDATAKAYLEIFGKPADTSKLGAILTPERSSYFASLGGDALGQKAAMVGFLLAEAAKSGTGPYAVMNENFLYDLADGIAAYGVDAHIYLGAGPNHVGVVGVAQ